MNTEDTEIQIHTVDMIPERVSKPDRKNVYIPASMPKAVKDIRASTDKRLAYGFSYT